MNKNVFRTLEVLESRIAPAATVIQLADLDGAAGFEVSSTNPALTPLGRSIAHAGDVNGDGFDDLIIGAPYAGGIGAAYVIFGKEVGFAPNFDPSALNGTNGFTVLGVNSLDLLGWSVSAAGDIDSDGFDDVIIGAPSANSTGPGTPETGAAYVIFGQAAPFAATINAGALNGVNGFAIFGESANDQLGYGVSGVSDLNDDGLDDLIVGARSADVTGADSGAAYVIYGQIPTFPPVFNVTALTGTNGFRIAGAAVGDGLGNAVAGLGDMNGDVRDDLVVGASGANEGTASPGAAYVIFGRGIGAGLPFPATLNVSALTGADGFKFTAASGTVGIGGAVASAGDFNDDGFDDVLIGVPLANNQGTNSGGAAVLFGHAGAFPAKIFDTEARGAVGFVMFGERSEDFAGIAVGGEGDVNGDGFDDIIIGAPGIGFLNVESPGKNYVILGRAAPFADPIKLKNFESSNLGWLILGEAASDRAGAGVALGGDVNGDGFADVLIAAPGAGPSDSGAAYVVLGTPVKQANPRVVTFTDPDGDRVTVKLTKGVIEAGDLIFEQTQDGALLREINLAGKTGLDGASLIITVKTTAAADSARGLSSAGQINIGKLDVTGVNLKKVKLPGSLVTLLGGDGSGDGKLRGIKALTVGALGADGGNFPGLMSQIEVPGGIGKLRVLRDISQAVGNLGGGLVGGLGKLVVGGGILGSQLNIAGLLSSLDIRDGIEDSVLRVGADVRNMVVLGDVLNSEVNVGGKMDNIVITGSLIDSEVRARGRLDPESLAKAAAVRRLIVNGDMRNSSILAGYDAAGAAVNADAGIGKVTIKGAFEASNIAAGVVRTNTYFGDGDDALIAGGNAIVARIASVTIKGTVLGSAGAGDHFGIVAEEIAALKIGGVVQALTPGPGNDLAGLALGGTSDVKAREVATP